MSTDRVPTPIEHCPPPPPAPRQKNKMKTPPPHQLQLESLTLFYGRAPYGDECRHVFVDGKGYEGPRRRNTSHDSRGVKRGPGVLHIEGRISLLMNILFFRMENSGLRQSESKKTHKAAERLEVFLWRRNCSQVVNLPFMGHAPSPGSFCFPNRLNYISILLLA